MHYSRFGSRPHRTRRGSQRVRSGKGCDVTVVGQMREETGNETGETREMHRALRIGTDSGALSYRVAPPGFEPGLS
jgi:hypothetical protein